MTAQEVREALKAVATKERAESNAWFFKTGEGQYGYGDQFLGVTVPQQRSIAKNFYKDLSLEGAEILLKSPWHEERLTALFIIVLKYQKGDTGRKDEIANLYLKNTTYINNWDLVDSSAEHIIGPWLQDSPYKMKVLSKLARSKDLWERRIAMLSSFHYIKQGRVDESLEIIEILLHDSHDLIQKAVGWMLREIGKRVDKQVLLTFLNKHAATMPRTSLRYAIEHFPQPERQQYMNMRQ